MRILEPASATVTLVLISFSANAAFIGVLPASPGGSDWQAYYDDQLDITWTADASINGQDSWGNQVAWVAGLTIDGVTGWRLPSMDVNGDDTIVDCSAVTTVVCQDNELGYMFHQNNVTVGSPGDFMNVLDINLSSTLDPAGSWLFLMGTGIQAINVGQSLHGHAWAVRDGNVAAVPVPPAVWLFGSALGLLGWMRRKRNL